VEYDPVSKRIIALGRAGFYAYDPATGKAEKIPLRGVSLGYANHMTFYPPNGKLYYIMRKGPVIEVTLDRKEFKKSSYRKLATTGEAPGHGEPGYDYDAGNRVIGGGVTDSTFYAFDPRTNHWAAQKMLGGKPGNMAFHAIAYDPVDKVFIFIARRRTWAFKYRPPAGEATPDRPAKAPPGK